MALKLAAVAAVGFLVSIVSIRILSPFARRLRLVHSAGIPLTGGPAVALAFTLAGIAGAALAGIPLKLIAGIMVSSGFVFAFGIVDDIRELSISAKFLTQTVAAGILIASGVRTRMVMLNDTLNICVTLIWLVGITNAFNHLDILDGLSGLTAAIISFGFMALALLSSDPLVLVLSAAFFCAVSGFLLFNLPPAKIYLGNSGSHFLGFVLATLAVVVHYAPLDRKLSLFAPLVILGFPIFDTAFLVAMRLGKNHVPFKKSNDHLMLRLTKMGFSKRRCLAAASLIAFLFVFCGIIVSQASVLFGSAVLAFVGIGVTALSLRMKKVQIDG